MRVLKLGTRKSHLAIAQSRIVKNMIEAKFADVRVELVGIEVSVDESKNNEVSRIPLWQLDGKNFWSKELDEYLLTGQTDLSVHSYKDLSMDRPDGIVLGAIPARENPRDIALFGPRVFEKLKNNQPILIGTSSPRRMLNSPLFLETVLPHLGASPQIKVVPLRGNVPTRIKRLWEDPHSEKYLDGVVIAMAGVVRLFNASDYVDELKNLLRGLRWMVLPLTGCPAAPGQGAMAIECRADDAFTLNILRQLHDPATERHVIQERSVLADMGGGCHQKFGATSIDAKYFSQPLMFIHGETPVGEKMDELRWNAPLLRGERPVVPWDGALWRSKCTEIEYDDAIDWCDIKDHVFVAHARAVPDGAVNELQKRRIWTSGVKSWQALARKGIWVEGCADGLGFDFIRSTLGEPVLQLDPLNEWSVVTHQEAHGWHEGHVVGSYNLITKAHVDVCEAIAQATHVYWSSASQYLALKDCVSVDVHHSCGAGKTADLLVKEGLKSLTVFPHVSEWRKAVGVDKETEYETHAIQK